MHSKKYCFVFASSLQLVSVYDTHKKFSLSYQELSAKRLTPRRLLFVHTFYMKSL